VKGITVEIGGDTGPLSSALKGVNGTIRETGSQLKDVNRLLKLDPTNITLLGQKAGAAQKELLALQEKEKTLKAADSDLKKQLSEGKISTEQYQAYQRELISTQEKIKGLKKESTTVGNVLEAFGEKAKTSGQKIASAGEKMLPATVAIGGVGAAAVKTASDFETSMSQTAGALDIPMSKMGNLRALALKMGADTQFSAEQAGQAMTELAKGGLTEAEIQSGALKSTMDLAASSGMELGDAANTVVQAMGGFGLTAKDSAQAVNALAGAAAASSTDVGPLADALSQCAAQAHTAGWSIQDTTAALGAFADAGITGSDAGTSLKTMLQRLGAPTDAAAKEMKSLGINVWDSSGHMKDAGGIADELKTHLGGLSDQQKQQALTTIFGSDATRAATVLMGEGSAGLAKYTKATNDQTAASRLANSQMGPTEKALEQLKGSLETAAISIGTMLLPMIQKLTGFIKGLADNFAALNPQQQQIIITILGIVAVLGPLLILIGKLKEGIGGLIGGIAFFIRHPIVAGILVAIAAIAALVAAVKHLWDTNEGFRNGLISGWNKIKSIWGGAPEWFGNVWNAIIDHFKPDMISTRFENAWGAVKSAWSGASGWFGNVWNAIIDHFKPDMISTRFKNAWDAVKSAWSGASGWFGNVWNAIIDHFKPDMISTGFKNAWGAVKSAWNGAGAWFGGIWKSIENGFKNLNPFQWGKDLMNGMANGINSAANAVKAAVGNVAQSIRSFLHFSVPDEGPLTDYESWMPDFMAGLARGIDANKYKVVQSMRSLATDMSISPAVRPAYAGGYAAPQIAVAPTIDNAPLAVAVKYLAGKMDKIANRDIVLYTDNMKLAESANRGNAQIGKRYHRTQG
jgi:TP901 family phage tail tape measure protein